MISCHWVRDHAVIYLPAWMDKFHPLLPKKPFVLKQYLLLQGSPTTTTTAPEPSGDLILALMPLLWGANGKYTMSVTEGRANTFVIAVAPLGFSGVGRRIRTEWQMQERLWH